MTAMITRFIAFYTRPYKIPFLCESKFKTVRQISPTFTAPIRTIMRHQHRDPHDFESNSIQNQDLKKSFEDINNKLKSFQKELQHIHLPLGAGSNNYFLQGKNSEISPIERNAQTSATTQASLDNLAKGKNYQRNNSSSFLKAESPIIRLQSLQEANTKKIRTPSRQIKNPNKETHSPKRHSGGSSTLDIADESPKKIPDTTGHNATQASGSPKSGYKALGFSGIGNGGNIKPTSPKKGDEKLGLEEVKKRLKKIFQFYTTFGDRCNTSNLKSNKFHKMMLDCGVRGQYLTQRELDLLFVAENKHNPNMDYQTFLQLLVKVAENRYHGTIPSREALDRFLKEHMLPLYNSLYQLSDMGVEDIKLKEPIIERVLVILKSVHVLLVKLYQTYFPWEVQTSQQQSIIKQRDEVSLFSLLRDFDVCPALMTKGAVTMIWTEIMETPLHELSRNSRIESMVSFMERDIGTLFTFSRFCTLLVRIASVVYEEYLKAFDFPIGQAEKLTMLLERMDMSTGMQEFERKTCITHNNKTSLLVPKEILEKARLQEFESGTNSTSSPNEKTAHIGLNLRSEESNFSHVVKRSQNSGKIQRIVRSSVASSKSYKNLLNASIDKSKRNSVSFYGTDASQFENYEFEDSEVVLTFEKYNEGLLRIFQYYCSFGEPMNNTRLKSMKFVKMLKECGLLTGTKVHDQSSKGRMSISKSQPEERVARFLTQTEADLIFATLTGSKHQKEALEKNQRYNSKIKSPYFVSFNHLHKNNPNTTQSSGRLSFEGFLKAIEMIAHKLVPDLEIAEPVEIVIERFLMQLDTQISQNTGGQRYMGGSSLKVLVNILKDSEVVDFLSVVHKSMMVYYNFYADKRRLLSFERFAQFCKDFAIFPDILSKVKIKSIFQTLSAIHSQAEVTEKVNQNVSITSLRKSLNQSYLSTEKKGSDHHEDEVIDQHLFIEGIALCAFEVNYEDPQPHIIYKICFLLERMNQSDGPMIVQKTMGLTRSPTGASWDIMAQIKLKYPEIFSSTTTEGNAKKDKFDDLLAQPSTEDYYS